METRKNQTLARGTRAFLASVAVSLAIFTGVTASDGATLTAVILAVLAITIAAPLTIRWRRQPTPLEAIRRAVNTPD
jgi:uncharacterized membrane protein YgaE (UPF0421/DUF939 family)